MVVIFNIHSYDTLNNYRSLSTKFNHSMCAAIY